MNILNVISNVLLIISSVIIVILIKKNKYLEIAYDAVRERCNNVWDKYTRDVTKLCEEDIKHINEIAELKEILKEKEAINKDLEILKKATELDLDPVCKANIQRFIFKEAINRLNFWKELEANSNDNNKM